MFFQYSPHHFRLPWAGYARHKLLKVCWQCSNLMQLKINSLIFSMLSCDLISTEYVLLENYPSLLSYTIGYCTRSQNNVKGMQNTVLTVTCFAWVIVTHQQHYALKLHDKTKVLQTVFYRHIENRLKCTDVCK